MTTCMFVVTIRPAVSFWIMCDSMLKPATGLTHNCERLSSMAHFPGLCNSTHTMTEMIIKKGAINGGRRVVYLTAQRMTCLPWSRVIRKRRARLRPSMGSLPNKGSTPNSAKIYGKQENNTKGIAYNICQVCILTESGALASKTSDYEISG